MEPGGTGQGPHRGRIGADRRGWAGQGRHRDRAGADRGGPDRVRIWAGKVRMRLDRAAYAPEVPQKSKVQIPKTVSRHLELSEHEAIIFRISLIFVLFVIICMSSSPFPSTIQVHFKQMFLDWFGKWFLAPTGSICVLLNTKDLLQITFRTRWNRSRVENSQNYVCLVKSSLPFLGVQCVNSAERLTRDLLRRRSLPAL